MLAALLAGCEPKVPEMTTDSGATSGGATDETLPTIQATTEPTTNASDTMVTLDATCDCVRNHGTYDVETCGWGPCGTIEINCHYEDSPPCHAATLDLEALDCALDLLIAGTPGVVAYHTYIPEGYEQGLLKIGQGHTGVAQTQYQYDLGYGASDFEVIQLRAPEYFQSCKDLADPSERYLCLQDWALGSAHVICAEGYSCSDIISPCLP